jgi:phosphatidylglycerophosphate synthase
MVEGAYQVADRRPIAARRLASVNRMAAWLMRAGVSANSISIVGMICGVLAGGCLWLTSPVGGSFGRILFLAAAGLVQLRLLANMLDGMVAVAANTASPLGELFNEAPDRISDAAVLVGLGYAAGGWPTLGWLAALLAVFTAYVRALGRSAGAGSDFRGPMAKQQRMFLVTVVGILCAIVPEMIARRAPAWCLGIVCAGCVVTICRRLGGNASKLRSAA